MSDKYTITIEEYPGLFRSRWYWSVYGPLRTQSDTHWHEECPPPPPVLFTWELDSGFARSKDKARSKADRAVKRARVERAQHLNREIIVEEIDV